MRKLALVLLALSSARAGMAQQPTLLRLAGPNGAGDTLPVEFHRGYAAVPLRGLDRIGWTVESSTEGGVARMGKDSIVVRERTPFFLWGSQLLQLTDEPYRQGEDLWVPLQLYVDFLPAHMPDAYAFHADRLTLDSKLVRPPDLAPVPVRAAAPAPDRLPAGSRPGVTPPPQQPARPAAGTRGRTATSPAPAAAPPAADDAAAEKRVIVIDPGHGGEDSGARGPGGVREKDLVLQLGLALARELEKRPDYEVHLTRDTDRLVPLWERGERATEIKGNRHGIFISLHLNAGSALDAQGFETYFLSEARTEHERRVAALENEAGQIGQKTQSGVRDQALNGIVQDLMNLDLQHWSAELAETVQKDLAAVEKGPNRGVKQGPLAVLTNALMPAVLIEVGFVSNATEARLLSSSDFQSSAAKAIAKSVDRFFASYPPGAEAAR